MDFKLVTECRICKSPALKEYINLGEVPLANALLNLPNSPSNKYPLKVLFCENCALSQLSIVIDPMILYKNYPYHSSISKTFRQHCLHLAEDIKKITGVKDKLVMDIAANDGCLLEQFREVGFKHLIAVEPSENLSKECANKGFDSRQTLFKASSCLPRADIITATNVLAHVDDLSDFALGIKNCLAIGRGSLCVIEVPYLYNLLEINSFDTIYHEHLSYFLFKPIKQLFEAHGLRVFNVERTDIHGGSLRIFICPLTYRNVSYPNHEGHRKAPWESAVVKDIDSTEVYPESNSVKELIEFERFNGLYDFKTYYELKERAESVREDLLSLLHSLKEDGAIVAGYGASAKGISLMNYCGIDSSLIKYIVDETPDKQGRYAPGSNIPIVDFSTFSCEKPDYIILLAWNFGFELREKTKHIKCKHILPIPRVRIL